MKLSKNNGHKDKSIIKMSPLQSLGMANFAIRDGVCTPFNFIRCLTFWHSSGKESQYLASKTIFIQKPTILMQELQLR